MRSEIDHIRERRLESLHKHAFDHAPGTVSNCPECRLISAWRAKP